MLILREEAENDIRDAYEWYEGKRKNLGKSFMLDVELALDRIEENPASYELVFEFTRRALCRRFPYAIYFVVDNLNIGVIAVLHQRRRPSVWQNRK